MLLRLAQLGTRPIYQLFTRGVFNPLIRGSYEHVTSSYNIHALSRKQVVRILKLIKQKCLT